MANRYVVIGLGVHTKQLWETSKWRHFVRVEGKLMEGLLLHVLATWSRGFFTDMCTYGS
jgi:hypothetical protein